MWVLNWGSEKIEEFVFAILEKKRFWFSLLLCAKTIRESAKQKDWKKHVPNWAFFCVWLTADLKNRSRENWGVCFLQYWTAEQGYFGSLLCAKNISRKCQKGLKKCTQGCSSKGVIWFSLSDKEKWNILLCWCDCWFKKQLREIRKAKTLRNVLSFLFYTFGKHLCETMVVRKLNCKCAKIGIWCMVPFPIFAGIMFLHCREFVWMPGTRHCASDTDCSRIPAQVLLDVPSLCTKSKSKNIILCKKYCCRLFCLLFNTVHTM